MMALTCIVGVVGCRTMSFREVSKLVTQASLRARPEEPRSLTFRPVHDGPAEIAAPLKLPEAGDGDTNPGEERIFDTDTIAGSAEISELPPGVEILPHGGFDVADSGDYSEGYVQPMSSSTRVPAPLIR